VTDEPPDLSRLEYGDQVRVHYRSERSGNEVTRKGEVEELRPGNENQITWVHTEQRGPLKHQYVTLMKAETKAGDSVVTAHSQTVSAAEPNDGDPVMPGRTCAITFTTERVSFLGVVDRIMRDGVNINFDHPGNPFGVNS